MVHEFGGQEVEELGVRRARAVEAEVARRVDDAGAEVMMPEAVHDDTRGERIVLGDNPVGQGFAAIGFGRVGREGQLGADEGERTGCYGFARLGRVTAMLAEGWARLFEPADVAARVGGDLRELGLKFDATKRKCGHFRRLAGGHFAEGG